MSKNNKEIVAKLRSQISIAQFKYSEGEYTYEQYEEEITRINKELVKYHAK